MKKHAKKALRSVLAFAMAVVLLATSLPIAFAAGDYDPTPVFSEDATLWAWVTDDGDVQVIYPQAQTKKPNDNYPDKHIATYYITLYDLGPLTEVHNDPATEKVPQAQIVEHPSPSAFASDGTGTVTFTELAKKGVTLDDTHRFSVEVLAQDSTGWVSEPLTTVVSDVPQFVYDEESYNPLTEDPNAMREMLMFEAGKPSNSDYNDNTISTGGTGGSLDYIQTGNQLTMLGRKEQAGAEDPDTGIDTSAYGFRVNGTNAQSFNTTWSREHWIAEGAEEVWFWFDLSQVSVQDLAFELKTQGKRYMDFYWDNSLNTGGVEYHYSSNDDDGYSAVTYSTKGYTGDDGYVLIQADDGSWQTVPLENGGIDLSGYKGYIRVPIQFICSTSATYAEASNINFGQADSELGVPGGIHMPWEDVIRDEAAVKNYFDSDVLLDQPVLVDPAGTPISSALLIQYRQFSMDKYVNNDTGSSDQEAYVLPYGAGYPSETSNDYAALQNPSWGAAILAVGPRIDDCSTNNDGTKAYVDSDGVIQNRENGYHALDDICGAGFSYTSMSADSVNKSFFLDSVLFYRTDGEQYPEDMVADAGKPASNYYNQSVEIPHSILNQIDKLITTPDLGDFRAVQYIDELIAGYRKAIEDDAQNNLDPNIVSEENLANSAASLGMSDVWQRYLDARQACVDGGTMKYDEGSGTYTYLPNNEATDLVPELIQSLEKLPDPSQVTSVSDTLRDEIIRLYQLYRRLNLTQLDAMSAAEEQRILDYVALVQASNQENNVVVGQALANNKFILFDNFDNQETGTRSWQLENYPNLGSGVKDQDYRYTKGFVTYNTKRVRGFMGIDDDTPSGIAGSFNKNSPSDTGFQKTSTVSYTADTDPLNVNYSWATIEEAGINGSNAAVMTIDSQHYSQGQGCYNVLSVSYLGQDGTGEETRARNMGQFNLGQLGVSYTLGDGQTDDNILPLALAFYVDFTGMTNFRLSADISSYHGGTYEDYVIDMGANSGDRKYWLLDNKTGEWVRCNSSNAMYTFVSSDGADTDGDGTVDLCLDNYKGWIMIPLYHFKNPGNSTLAYSADALNGIYRVLIGVAPGSSEAAANMDGKSYVIDNIGFAYQPDIYPNVTGRNDQDFEEVCAVKSLPAQKFEDAISIIEPSDQANFAERVATARTLYNALSDYQKNNTQSVKQAYEKLVFYEQIVLGKIPQDQYLPAHTTMEFTAFVNGLSNGLKNASVTGDHDLPYPGVKDTPDESGKTDGRADAVNYEAYDGLTKELAEKIIKEYYDKSYSRYTAEQKAALGETATQFLNAYNAASRCYDTLEGLLTDSNTFLNELYNPADASTSLFRTLSDIYPKKTDQDGLGTVGDMTQPYPYDKSTPYGTRVTAEGTQADEGYFISISDTKALDHISKTYRSQMNYYAKALLVAGELQEGVKNIPNAVRKLVYNSYSTDRHGDPFTGGIWTLYNRYLTLYNDAKKTINDGKPLSDQQLDDLKLATDEYEMLLPTYHDVAELYDLIQQIYDLFPVVKSTFTATGDTSSVNDRTMILAYDGQSATVENTADPIYTLTQFEQYLTNPDGQGKLTLTSENGGTLKSSDGTISLPYTLTYNGTAADLANGTTADSYAAPMDSGVALHVKIDKPQKYTVTLTDKVTLTFTYQYTDRHGILREVTDQKTLTIYYTTEDIYTVTIPAEVDIPWGTENVSTDFDNGTGYRVTCNLNTGSSVSVQPTLAATSFELINAGTTESIACTGTDTAAGTFTGQVIEGKGTGPSISIAASEWKNIPVAAYRADDQITYTVTYTDGSATP